jgi:methionine-gamma-lyase
LYIAKGLQDLGLSVRYPGLPEHRQHNLMNSIMNKEYGYGGIVSVELGSVERANEFMRLLQDEGVGYCAVSLGYFKTLFSNSGHSTSSEVPCDVQRKMGLSEGLVRFSIGLDNDIALSLDKMKDCLRRIKPLQ